MHEYWYPVLAIAVIALVTWLFRAFPFLLFGKRKLPKIIVYLGKVLPAAIMLILVIYCLRSTDLIHAPFGIPEICASLVVIGLHIFRKNMYLSIIAGTICYMILIRVL